MLTGLNRPVSPERLVAGWPYWTRDEKQLVFNGVLNGEATAVAVAADGTGSPKILAYPKALGMRSFNPTSAGWNDSSVFGMVEGSKPGALDLGTIHVGADTTFVPYLRGDWNEIGGAVSPDGRWDKRWLRARATTRSPRDTETGRRTSSQ